MSSDYLEGEKTKITEYQSRSAQITSLGSLDCSICCQLRVTGIVSEKGGGFPDNSLRWSDVSAIYTRRGKETKTRELQLMFEKPFAFVRASGATPASGRRLVTGSVRVQGRKDVHIIDDFLTFPSISFMRSKTIVALFFLISSDRAAAYSLRMPITSSKKLTSITNNALRALMTPRF